MTKDLPKTGRELERRVANAYRQMGARKVEHDVELAGNQIDVYVELETPGRLLHRIVIETKDWSKKVGIDIINGFAAIVNLLRHERLIDQGIIVSTMGFSRQARNAAEVYGIRLLELADLDTMVKIKDAGREQAKSVGHERRLLRQRLLEGILLHLYEQAPGEKISLTELCEALDVSSRESVVEVLHILHSNGWVRVKPLGSGSVAMLCEITYEGRRIVWDIQGAESGTYSDEQRTETTEGHSGFAVNIAEFDSQRLNRVQHQDFVDQVKDILENPHDKRIAFFILDHARQEAQYTVRVGLVIDSVSCGILCLDE